MARTQNEITRDERTLNLLENIFSILNEIKSSINNLDVESKNRKKK
tara:strand:- start:299 stop:436 length:138 start_codon:yes stop_codon:yes gene_type:complete